MLKMGSMDIIIEQGNRTYSAHLGPALVYNIMPISKGHGTLNCIEISVQLQGHDMSLDDELTSRIRNCGSSEGRKKIDVVIDKLKSPNGVSHLHLSDIDNNKRNFIHIVPYKVIETFGVDDTLYELVFHCEELV